MESVGNTFMIALGGVFESHSQSQELRNPQQVKNQIYHSQQNRRLKMNIWVQYVFEIKIILFLFSIAFE